MRLLLFTRFFWPEGSGAELATYQIIKNILTKWFDATIVSGTNKPIYDIMNNTKFVYNPLLKATTKPELLLRMFLRYNTFEKLIKSADVIYIPSNSLIPLAIFAKKMNPEIKIVIHLHDYQPISYSSVILHDVDPGFRTDLIVEKYDYNDSLRAIQTGFFKHINKLYSLALDYADNIITVSKRQLEILARYIPTLKRKASVIYNPPPPIKPLRKEFNGPPSFLYTGGEKFTKGFHVFLKASLELTKRGQKPKYLITRNISKKWLYTMEKLNSRYHECYSLLGRIDHNQLIELHKYVLALIFPSIYEEPLPYTVVESMMLGTIPIASKIGGVPEIVEGSYAEKLLLKPGDFIELANNIEDVTALSREELVDIGESIRESISRKLDVNRLESQYAKIFT